LLPLLIPWARSLSRARFSTAHSPQRAKETKAEHVGDEGLEFVVVAQGSLAPLSDAATEWQRIGGIIAAAGAVGVGVGAGGGSATSSSSAAAAAEEPYATFDAITTLRRFIAYQPAFLAQHR
jgi:hypothetical protein